MSILMRKLFTRLHEESPDGGDPGTGAPNSDLEAAETLQREQEAEAARSGWQPRDQYKGPEGKWKDAATFLRDRERFKDRLQHRVELLTRELEEFKGTAKQFAEFQQRQIEQRDAEIANLQKKLRTDLRAAIREGDDEAADAIEQRIDLLSEERENVKKQLAGTKQAPTEQPPNAQRNAVDANGNTDNPVVQAWIDDGNSWFQSSKPMREYAFAIADELMQSGEKRRGREFLDLVTEKMREAFPVQLGEGRGDPTRRGSMAETSSGLYRANARTEADLSEADRALMNRGIKEGWTTKEKFLSTVFNDGPRIHKTQPRKK